MLCPRTHTARAPCEGVTHTKVRHADSISRRHAGTVARMCERRNTQPVATPKTLRKTVESRATDAGSHTGHETQHRGAAPFVRNSLAACPACPPGSGKHVFPANQARLCEKMGRQATRSTPFPASLQPPACGVGSVGVSAQSSASGTRDGSSPRLDGALVKESRSQCVIGVGMKQLGGAQVAF